MNLTLEITPVELAALMNGFAASVTAKVVAALQPSFAQELKAMAAIDDELATLTTTVANDATVEASAVTLINGIGAQITAAVNAALAAGATPAELASVTALNTSLATSSGALAAAVTANTPAASPSPAAQTAA